MSNLNWRKAKLHDKRTVSVLDESGFRDRDAASRWLSKQAKKPRKKQSSKQGRAA